jgi:hypothetical protein
VSAATNSSLVPGRSSDVGTSRWTGAQYLAGALLLALVMLGGKAMALAGQEFCPVSSDIEIGPALIVSDAGDLRPGIEGIAGVCQRRYAFRPNFPTTTYLQASLEGLVPFSDIRTPHQVKASAGLGLTMSLSKENPDTDIEANQYLFHRGFMGIAVRGVYEASTDFEEQAFTGGAELRYVDPLRWYLPSLVIAGDFVMPTRSASRDFFDLDGESFRRLLVRGYWLIPVGTRITAEIDGSFFRTQGLEAVLREIGWASGEAIAATLAYGPLFTVKAITVESLWVRFATGQVPVNQTNLKAFTIGLRLGNG